MSFLRAARAALAGQSCLPRIPVAFVFVAVVVLAGLSLSCGSSSHSTSVANHNAYVTLPARGSVLLLHINGATGAITLGAETPHRSQEVVNRGERLTIHGYHDITRDDAGLGGWRAGGHALGEHAGPNRVGPCRQRRGRNAE